jgi:hypothetical protein
LSFGEQGVEGQGRFAGSGQAGDGGDPVVRDPQGDVFEIVLARAFDDQVVRGAIWGNTVGHPGVLCRRKPTIVASAGSDRNVAARRQR